MPMGCSYGKLVYLVQLGIFLPTSREQGTKPLVPRPPSTQKGLLLYVWVSSLPSPLSLPPQKHQTITYTTLTPTSLPMDHPLFFHIGTS